MGEAKGYRLGRPLNPKRVRRMAVAAAPLSTLGVQIWLAAGCNRRQSIGSWGIRKRFGTASWGEEDVA
ncbi:hypothetical protein DLREEDagr8_34210 [Dongia sp. agr-C8]